MKIIIDKNECKPLSDNVEGKLVVIKPDFFKPEFREAKYQIVLATGGFGSNVEMRQAKNISTQYVNY